MQHTTKTRVLRCPCGVRMQARDDEALRVMLREHIERQHPYADAPHDELLDVMVSSGQALMDILNDVLDLSKIESGRTEVECVAFSLQDMLSGLDAMFRPQAASKGIELIVDNGAPDRLAGDPSRLRQILLNLLGNAIKFTEAGHVSLRSAYLPRGPRGGRLVLIVSDSGIGMARGAIDRIFQPFIQADSSTTRRFGGTGLGLAITRRLVDLLEGRIDVESRLGIGTSFKVELPIQLAPDDGRERAPSPLPPPTLPNLSLARYRVLLVEDNKTNQFLMMRLLDRLGLQADCAANGREALLAWEAGRYDLILMDVEMPVLDGIGATREIRRREAATTTRRVPIIALSAEASPEGARAAIDAGMNRFITKPITIDRLTAAITETFQGLPSA